VTVNPIASAIFGAYALDEPITVNLVLGLLLVAIGILVASSTPKETTVRI
jgi:drug/metabolite transporter (DMT)-like permease